MSREQLPRPGCKRTARQTLQTQRLPSPPQTATQTKRQQRSRPPRPPLLHPAARRRTLTQTRCRNTHTLHAHAHTHMHVLAAEFASGSRAPVACPASSSVVRNHMHALVVLDWWACLQRCCFRSTARLAACNHVTHIHLCFKLQETRQPPGVPASAPSRLRLHPTAAVSCR